ncbi:MAG: carboxypeptidase-like regulatory domain-containing protein [Planctomycetota bacterium]
MIEGSLPQGTFDDVLLLARFQRGDEVQTPELTDQGTFTFRWLQPGTWRFVAYAEGHAMWEQEVEVQAGQVTRVEPELIPYRTVGDVSGVLTSQSGTYQGQMLVFLSTDLFREPMIYPTTWVQSEAGNWQARFLFQNVPEGVLQLSAISLADRARISGIPERMEAPVEELRLVVLDEEPSGQVDLALLDAETGEPLERVNFRVQISDPLDRSWNGVKGERWTMMAGGMRWNTVVGSTPLLKWPWEAGLDWSVTAEGYVPAQGDETDVQGFGTPEARLEVRLHRVDGAAEPR